MRLRCSPLSFAGGLLANVVVTREVGRINISPLSLVRDLIPVPRWANVEARSFRQAIADVSRESTSNCAKEHK
jgi:hypothetical protein